jgi:hypothetical protein
VQEKRRAGTARKYEPARELQYRFIYIQATRIIIDYISRHVFYNGVLPQTRAYTYSPASRLTSPMKSHGHPSRASILRDGSPGTTCAMADYFHLTEREAASHFDVCLTSFKKICRARGLSRWPHRKVSPAAASWLHRMLCFKARLSALSTHPALIRKKESPSDYVR